MKYAVLTAVLTTLIFVSNSHAQHDYSLTKLWNEIEEDKTERYSVGKTLNQKPDFQDGGRDDSKERHKTVWIKRLVPHNIDTNPLQTGNKLKMFYRPLVRLHLTKQNKPSFFTNPVKTKGLSYVVESDKTLDFNDEHLLQPFKVNTARELTPMDILVDVEKYVRKEQDVRKVRALKYALLEVLEDRPLDLRSLVYVEPGQATPEMVQRPSKVHVEAPVMPDGKKQWGSQYSYSDYWTYNKPVHEDKCEGDLVQWGNICIETPQH